MDPLDGTYRSWLLANPKAFVEGARGFCKQAEGSLWNDIKPWLFALAAGYVGLKGGEWWGRYAQKHNNALGPINGPLAVGLGKLLPNKYSPWYPTPRTYGATPDANSQTTSGQGG